MAVSTIFTNTEDQVWIAQKHRRTTEYFGTLDGLKDYLANVKHAGFRTAWEETCEDSKKRPMRACSKLVICVSSTRYGGQYVGEVWRDTGWRAWRDR